MKILHVVTAPRAEGTPRLVLDWCKVKQHNHIILFLTEENNELTQDFLQYSQQVYFNKVPLKSGIRKLFQLISISKKYSQKELPDIVICWNTGFSAWVLLGARLAGVKKLIAHAGNPVKINTIKEIIIFTLSFLIHYFIKSKIICCSKYVKNTYCKHWFIPKSVFFYVYNCINTSNFIRKSKSTNNTNKTKKAVMVATLENHKDHKTLLDAWQLVSNQYQNIELELAGNGTLRTELETYSKHLALTNVTFLGTVKNIPQLLQEADIFVFSTTMSEGFGTVLIEAMAVGLPIIASDVPACREVLHNGKYGLLVEPYNKNILAERIIDVFNDRIHFNIDENEKYARSFTPEKMIIEYLDIVQ
ncbi:MAG: glycosyltransferase [Endomicrobiia bacterium]